MDYWVLFITRLDRDLCYAWNIIKPLGMDFEFGINPLIKIIFRAWNHISLVDFRVMMRPSVQWRSRLLLKLLGVILMSLWVLWLIKRLITPICW